MTDTKTPRERSLNMARIRSADTTPEMTVRKVLFGLGYRYRLHGKGLPGHPDIVMAGRKVVVFVHGCFWHMHPGCTKSTIPATRRDFWEMKLKGNRLRDLRVRDALLAQGWRVLWIWQCAVTRKADVACLPERLRDWIEGHEPFGEIPSSDNRSMTA